MSIAELAVFKKYISNINVYFEFGVGGSTVFVYENTNAQIIGVDSSSKWIEQVSKHVDDRVNLKFIDIGPVGACLKMSRRKMIGHYILNLLTL